jgi:ribosomal protein L20A (L18A)
MNNNDKFWLIYTFFTIFIVIGSVKIEHHYYPRPISTVFVNKTTQNQLIDPIDHELYALARSRANENVYNHIVIKYILPRASPEILRTLLVESEDLTNKYYQELKDNKPILP